MPRQTEDIIREIRGRREEILKNLDPVRTYVKLKEMYERDEVQNPEFCSLFKKYYGLNRAGLGRNLENRFFELLSEKRTDLEYILSELHKIPRLNGQRTIQFVFATKLIHTVNNNKPIYDSKVSKVIEKEVDGNTKEEKIESCKDIYKYLERRLYPELLENTQIRRIMLRFREIHQVNESTVGDIKVLDFIMWSLGDIKQE